MLYRSFKIQYSSETFIYSISIRDKNKKQVLIKSKNLNYIKKQIDNVLDFHALDHIEVQTKSKTQSFWGTINK
ncbi:hypothetical protein GCM10007987_01620 [Aliivibrio fischeri]|uniref:hypothetical protein n=1 Tax=Aliivibrio fischeri TaxID=668 RepID=UPI0012D9FBDA|nr:hypothetical protein [Aliivibrio fischeri]MUK75352.1 hypothetical protein [Aliivibrio fischeri]GGK21409.1 hypothetical protein GCM10007987_01620 [Aliivibrio fischeri]